MEEKEFSCWDEFLAHALELIAEAECNADVVNGGTVSPLAEPIFRGQANSEWNLMTSLERSICKERECHRYDLDMRTAATTISRVWRELRF